MSAIAIILRDLLGSATWSASINSQMTLLLPISSCVFEAFLSSYYAEWPNSSFANLPWSPGIEVKATRPSSLEGPTKSQWLVEKSELGFQDFFSVASQPESGDLSEKSHRIQHRLVPCWSLCIDEAPCNSLAIHATMSLSCPWFPKLPW